MPPQDAGIAQVETSPPRTRILGAILITFVISIAGVGAYLYLSAPPLSSTDRLTPFAIEARKLLEQGKVAEARAVFESMDKEGLDPYAQAFIDTALAGIVMKENRLEGARLYAAVASNEGYPKKSRAFAIIEFATGYIVKSDISLADPFFNPAELAQLPTLRARYVALMQKSYGLHHFGLAAAIIGRDQVDALIPAYKEADTPEERADVSWQAGAIGAAYLAEIDSLMPDIMPPDAKALIYPATILAKAVLLQRLEQLEAPDTPSPGAAYEAAIVAAGESGMTGQEQFARFYYIGYLAHHEAKEAVVEQLRTLASQVLAPEFVTYLATPTLLDTFSSLGELAQSDDEIRSLLAELGVVVPEVPLAS